jgi:hypothetical protein
LTPAIVHELGHRVMAQLTVRPNDRMNIAFSTCLFPTAGRPFRAGTSPILVRSVRLQPDQRRVPGFGA